MGLSSSSQHHSYLLRLERLLYKCNHHDEVGEAKDDPDEHEHLVRHVFGIQLVVEA